MSERRENGSARSLGPWLVVAIAILGCFPWMIVHFLGMEFGSAATALLTGSGILCAAFLLSWAVEVAEIDLPQALAVSILALVAVLPEYAVDATFAWKAARDPEYLSYALANMTGANRMLIGLGWSMVVFLAWIKLKSRGIKLSGTYGIDNAVLLAATAYAVVPLLKGNLSLFDTAVFAGLYVIYIVAAARSEKEEEHELVGPSEAIAALGPTGRRLVTVVFLVLAAVAILIAAEPFSESLVDVGTELGIDEFILVQWIAPIASEAPEMVVAALLVWKARPAAGIRTLISSKVNQWTLLVGTLPLVYSISAGHTQGMALDPRQIEEIALTAAQSFFAIVVVADGHINRRQAIALFTLFFLQLALPLSSERWIFTGVYIGAAFITLLASRRERRGLADSYRLLFRTLVGRGPA